MEKKLGEVMPIVEKLVKFQTKGVDTAIPMLVGPPGIGKTAALLDLFNKRGWGLIHLHIPLKPLEELSGIPLPTELEYEGDVVKGTVWSLPDILVPIVKMSKEYPLVGVFLDDMHLAGPDHMCLCYELFTEKTLRGYKIPSNVAFTLAGNESSRAGARTMFSAIVNRVAWLKVTHDLEGWRRIALKMDVDPAIIAFLTNDRYSKYAQEEEQAGKPWASLRAWTRFSCILSELEKVQDVIYYATAHVGKNAAGEFGNFWKLFKSVKVEQILSDSWEVPANPTDVFISARAALAHVCGSKKHLKEKKVSFARLLAKLIESHPEIAVSILKDLLIMEKEKIKAGAELYNTAMDYLIESVPDKYEKLIEDLSLV